MSWDPGNKESELFASKIVLVERFKTLKNKIRKKLLLIT